MNYQIPDNWRMMPDAEDEAMFYGDDGRDYSKPMFIRKDELARIYFNEMEFGSKVQYFGISFDSEGDGACCDSLAAAFEYADKYIKKYITKE
jgi:hypothetical protein